MTENTEIPQPELSDCMELAQVRYENWPNSTQNSQTFHKKKLEELDRNYREPVEKNQWTSKS